MRRRDDPTPPFASATPPNAGLRSHTPNDDLDELLPAPFNAAAGSS
jgi:hypothetical protein